MIRYDKGWWGLKNFTRMYGSAFPRALPFSVTAAVLAGVLSYFFAETLDSAFLDPYPFQTFAFVAGFMVVFRSNLSYRRYWEGRTFLQLMTSKLSDAAVLALTFDREAVAKVNPTEEQVKEHQWFRDTVIHLCSLLHAVALATLRTDYNMENIVAHDSNAHAPRANIRLEVEDLKQEHGLGAHVSSILSGVYSSRNPQSKGSLRERKSRPSNESGGTVRGGQGDRTSPAKLQHLPEDRAAEVSLPDVQKDSHHAYETAGLTSFWDYFMLSTSSQHAAKLCRIMKLPVVGGMTQAEGVALGAFVTSGDQCVAVPDLNLGIHGVLLDDGMYAPAPTERVHTLLSWLQQVIIERIHAGGVKASPPIQARIHDTLGGCMTGFEQCKKLVDTPFPFPWAQAVNIVLLIFTLGAPVVVVAHTTSIIAAVLITFGAVQTHIMLNEVARDIEDPYHYDPNELPLPQMQYKLNERLLAVSHSRRPTAFTDVGELTGPGNTILLRESPGNTKNQVAPPTSALAPPQRPTVPPAGLTKPLPAPLEQSQETKRPAQNGWHEVQNSTTSSNLQSPRGHHTSSHGRGAGRRGVGESVSVAELPSEGPNMVSATTLSSSSCLDAAPGGGTGLSSALTTGSRHGDHAVPEQPVAGEAGASSEDNSVSFTATPPSQPPHPFGATAHWNQATKSHPVANGITDREHELLQQQSTVAYGLPPYSTGISETSSLDQYTGKYNSGAPQPDSIAHCDRPVPTSQADLQQYSSTAPVPAAAQYHSARWGTRAPPSTKAGSVARSARGACPPTSSRRPLSGELTGPESVWSSECPDQGDRTLHISGRADDKANGWPYNTRRW